MRQFAIDVIAAAKAVGHVFSLIVAPFVVALPDCDSRRLVVSYGERGVHLGEIQRARSGGRMAMIRSGDGDGDSRVWASPMRRALLL